VVAGKWANFRGQGVDGREGVGNRGADPEREREDSWACSTNLPSMLSQMASIKHQRAPTQEPNCYYNT